MNKSLATLIATAAAAGFSMAAHAQTTDTQPAPGTPRIFSTATVTTETVETKMVPPPAAGMTRSEAHDARIQSKADYKARKNIAEANHDLSKADCKINSEGAVERACKHDARMEEKKEKADAKLIHKQEVQDIDSQTK